MYCIAYVTITNKNIEKCAVVVVIDVARNLSIRIMQKKSTGQIMPSRESSSSNSDEDSVTIKVVTLNCWGLYGVSKFRRERMEAIGTYLAESEFDLVLLQELWCMEDFQTIQRLTIQALPYSHYFGHGVIGSGTCILSKYRLNNANFHEFTMNGYPTKFWCVV